MEGVGFCSWIDIPSGVIHISQTMKLNESEELHATAPALKEWGAIVSALGSGKQAITLRKGGIHEGEGGFAVKHERFWLFPTGFHEHREKLFPEIVENEVPATGGKVHLKFTAKVEAVRKLESIEQVKQLHAFHFWQPSVVEERFYQGKFEGLYLLLLRVFEARATMTIDYLPEYGGCRSWVDLPVALPMEGLSPSISDEDFEALKRRIFARTGSED